MDVRVADPDRDGAGCAAIYAPAVTSSASSFEEVAPDAAEMSRRIATTLPQRPWLVADTDDGLAGYAYAAAHRSRSAYRWAVDVSVYVDPARRRQGTGRRLYSSLLEQLTAQGFRIACAGIALPNEASVALHEALGFTPVGIYRQIGYKLGRWWDVGWWQRPLGDDAPHSAPGSVIRPSDPR